MSTSFHHVAISVRNLEKSQAFYAKLGFQEVHRWNAEDRSLSIVHLKLGDVVLELFAYTANAEAERMELERANNLPEIGVKHFGLNVADVTLTFNQMKQAGYEMGDAAVAHGRTKVDYFFIKDPDGMWVEIVQDDRGY